MQACAAFFSFILIFFNIATTQGVTHQAIDFSQPIAEKQIECLVSNYYNKIIIRAYASNNNGMFDYNVCASYKMAEGKLTTSVYMEASGQGIKTAQQQLIEMENGFTLCGLDRKVFSFYLSVTNPQNWSSNSTANTQFIRDFIDASQFFGFTMGILTSESDWRTITGNANIIEVNNGVQALPLWWSNAPASGQGAQNLNDFKPFGGFSRTDVQAVQFAKNQNICGISCNRDLPIQ